MSPNWSDDGPDCPPDGRGEARPAVCPDCGPLCLCGYHREVSDAEVAQVLSGRPQPRLMPPTMPSPDEALRLDAYEAQLRHAETWTPLAARDLVAIARAFQAKLQRYGRHLDDCPALSFRYVAQPLEGTPLEGCTNVIVERAAYGPCLCGLIP